MASRMKARAKFLGNPLEVKIEIERQNGVLLIGRLAIDAC